MQEAKEEVRSRLNIEDVIGEYVQLKRAGRNFKGLSPFSAEKTPSFVVSPDKHIWHDFSSGKGGDVFSFVMEVEGLDFRQALEQLAQKAGVELAQYDTQKSGELAAKKKRLLEANELAARYFQQCLLKNSHALEYVFKARKLSKEIVHEFRIGYAPDDTDGLVRILENKGFSKKELGDAGLTNRYGGDIFRGRMTVPLMDGAGQVIGFTGRILRDEPNAPKYLNTPQTLLYDKSRHVFGLSQAKESIRKLDEAVIVEGNLDVVSSHQAGVKNVVATAGTAITDGHLRALNRLSGNVKLAFDGDKAGLAATERAIPIAQTAGVELSIVSLPGAAKDPDELIQQDVALWEAAIKTARPVVDWVLEQFSNREDMSSAAGKRRFTTDSITIIKKLEDAVETEHYLRKVAEMTDSSIDSIMAKVSEQGRDAMKPLKAIVQPAEPQSDADENAQEDILLGIMIVHPITRGLLASFDPDLMTNPTRKKLLTYVKKNSEPFQDMPGELKDIETYVRIVELKAETRYGTWQASDIQLEAARLLRQIEVEQKKRTTEILMNELREAELEGDDTRSGELRTKLMKLIKETARG